MDKRIKDNNLIVKLACLVISFALWMYVSNVENKVREYKLDNIPVKILNEDKAKEAGLILIPNQDITTTLSLEGPANEIYKIKKDQFNIVVNLANYALKKGENNIPIEILSYPSNINIKNNSFLRVNIDLDNYIKKTLPVESNINVTTISGIYVNKIEFSPSTVEVSGAEEIVDKIKRLIVRGEVKDISDKVTMELAIIPIDENGNRIGNVELSSEKTKVTLEVKKGKNVPIKVITKGTPKEGWVLKSFTPDQNSVEVIGDEFILQSVNFVQTEPIDLGQFIGDGEVTAILNVPDKTSLSLSVNQIRVKFTFSQIISREFKVPITIKGSHQGYITKLDTESVTVKISGLKEIVDSIKENEILCEVDISNVPLEGGTIEPIIINPYEGSTKSTISPQTINVTFIKNDTEESTIQ